MSVLRRLTGHLLSARLARDGSARAIETDPLADGRRGASNLDAVTAGLMGQGAMPLAPTNDPGVRIAQSGDDAILEGIAAKTLASWIANRHQTLFPLALHVRNVPEAQFHLLLETIAVALLATGPASLERVDRVFTWLKSVGANDAHRIRLAYAIENAPTLHAVLERVHAEHVGPFAFAVALAALDQRVAVERLYLDFLAERLGLPSEMSRSLSQRFRL